MALRIDGFQRIRKMTWSPLGASSARQTRPLHEPAMNNLFNWVLRGFCFFFVFFVFFVFFGFWILAVWMPRKYSRLKLMYLLMNETNSKLLEMKADLSLASFNT